MTLAIGLVLSAAIGVSLGLIGGGGSIITLPVLVYALGVPPHEAVAMSLAVVGSTALVSALLHHRRGSVDWRTGALFSGSGIVSAYFGSRLTRQVPGEALLLIFAVLMLLVAALMLLRKERPDEAPHARSLWRSAAAGFGVGFLTGFLGVGGGFLIVPALVLFGGLAIRKAVGTSLFVIAVNCAAGLAGHFGENPPDPRLTILVALVAAAGAVGGSALSHRASPARLRKAFALFVIGVALYLVYRNAGAIL